MYFIVLTIRMVTNVEANKSVNTNINNPGTDETKHFIGNSTFGVALQLKGEHPEFLYDPTYFDIFISQEMFRQNGSNYIYSDYEEIGFKI